MSSVFVASQSSCYFLCSPEQVRLVENRLHKRLQREGINLNNTTRTLTFPAKALNLTWLSCCIIQTIPIYGVDKILQVRRAAEIMRAESSQATGRVNIPPAGNPKKNQTKIEDHALHVFIPSIEDSKRFKPGKKVSKVSWILSTLYRNLVLLSPSF